MKHFFLRIVFVGAFSFFGLLPQTTSAENGLVVSPAFQEVILTSDETQEDFSVSLTNETSVPMKFSLVPYDFGNLDESGGVAFIGGSNDLTKKYTLSPWMRTEKESLFVQPGQTEKVLVSVDNSDTLSPGGHYGAILFQADRENRDSLPNVVSVKETFATLVFVKKVGGEIYKLALESQEYKSKWFFLQNKLSLSFRNNGNVHVVPRGVATITDPLGRIIAKGIINGESSIILPEMTRIYPVELASRAWRFIPGHYTLAIEWRYDGLEDFSTTKAQFFSLPLTFVGGILFLVGIVFVSIVYCQKKKK